MRWGSSLPALDPSATIINYLPLIPAHPHHPSTHDSDQTQSNFLLQCRERLLSPPEFCIENHSQTIQAFWTTLAFNIISLPVVGAVFPCPRQLNLHTMCSTGFNIISQRSSPLLNSLHVPCKPSEEAITNYPRVLPQTIIDWSWQRHSRLTVDPWPGAPSVGVYSATCRVMHGDLYLTREFPHSSLFFFIPTMAIESKRRSVDLFRAVDNVQPVKAHSFRWRIRMFQLTVHVFPCILI